MACPACGPHLELWDQEDQDNLTLVDWRSLIRDILKDLSLGMNPTNIAWKFHQGLADVVTGMVQKIGISQVVLTGGVFQNALLSELTMMGLRKTGCQVYAPQQVLPNDGGIALGQIMNAGYSMERTQGLV